MAAELLAHMEDHRDALMAQGLSQEDAASAALQEMGSAAEIAPQLAKIHRPFWGYVEYVTRCVAYTLCISILFIGLFHISSYGLDSIFDPQKPADSFSHYSQMASVNCVTDSELHASDQFDGYTFTASRFAIWEWREYPGTEGMACIKLDVRDTTPWVDQNLPFENYLWIEDSHGNHYYNTLYSQEGSKNIAVYAREERLFFTSYELMLFSFPLQETEWIDIHYDRDGRTFLLHIDLSGGEAP